MLTGVKPPQGLGGAKSRMASSIDLWETQSSQVDAKEDEYRHCVNACSFISVLRTPPLIQSCDHASTVLQCQPHTCDAHHPVNAQCRKWRLLVVTSATPYLLQQSMASWSRRLPPGCAMPATPASHAFSTESFQEKGKNASLASTEPCMAMHSCQQLIGHCDLSSLPDCTDCEAAFATNV